MDIIFSVRFVGSEITTNRGRDHIASANLFPPTCDTTSIYPVSPPYRAIKNMQIASPARRSKLAVNGNAEKAEACWTL